MNVVATIQARMGSRRFPGKVMKEILKKPLIQWQIERLKKSKFIKKIVVSTSKNSKDDGLYNFCKNKIKVDVYRGSENDVLGRIANTVKKFKADIHVECFGDSPLIDPKLVDEFIYQFKRSKIDCITNTLLTSFPPGQEVMIYKGSKLLELNQLVSQKDPLREHVGYNFTRFKKKFSIKNIIAPKKYNFPNICMEVDEPIDLKFIKNIFVHFSKKKIKFFDLDEILNFLNKRKDLLSINKKVFRRWKKLRK